MKKIDFKNTDGAATEDFSIPSVGIEDIDRAVFDLFEKKLQFNLKTNGNLIKVPVVFAAGERFALTRRKNPIRDNNNTLILPIISILRGGINYSPGQSGRGSAITTRDQENYVIKKRLAKKDRQYQNLKNKYALKHQDNVTSRGHFLNDDISPGNNATPGDFASRRQGGGIKFSGSGGLVGLDSKNALGDNIFEVIQVPYPIFIAVSYNVTFWTQYLTQMNQIQEILLSNIQGQASEFVLKTETGYEFVASISEEFSSDTNLDNYSESERIIRSSIDITVPGYIINPEHPGLPAQVRSFFSAPQIEFGYQNIRSQVVKREKNKLNNPDEFILSDISTLDELRDRPKRGDSSEEIQDNIVNPFTGEEQVGFSKIISRDDRSGETVASNLIVKKIETQYE